MGSGDVPGAAYCKGGQCDLTCPDAGPEGGAVISCGADAGGPGCFDPLTNAQACGGCGNVCPSGNCKGGICQDASASTTGYVTSNPTLPFIDACSLPNSKTVVPSASSWTTSGVQNLPFPFTFFGTVENQFWIGSQGTLAFSATPNSIGFPSCSMGTPFTGYPAIVAFGDQNLATGTSGVCFAEAGADAGTSDAGGGPQFVVTWKQATDYGDPGSVLTFSIVLTQGTNTVDFLYQTLLGADGGLDPTVEGANASVGMQLSSTTYSVYSCNVTYISSTPYAVRFTPQ